MNITNLKDFGMVIDSLREELDAVKVYNERAAEATDTEAKEIFLHNAKEEKEHAAMLIAKAAKLDSEFAEFLEEFLGNSDTLAAEKNMKA